MAIDKPLTRSTLHNTLQHLSKQDPMLLQLTSRYGSPPLWKRAQSFETLVHIVLEQKVSLSSAQAVMQRVIKLCPGMSPGLFLQIPEAQLRTAGISGRKVSYCRSIAEALVQGDLSLKKLRRMPDERVLETLMKVRGIGPWTAGVYLLMAMRRPDAWASGDRALAVSLAECAQWDYIPEYADIDKYALRWQPHRATAARLLWHAYLERRKK